MTNIYLIPPIDHKTQGGETEDKRKKNVFSGSSSELFSREANLSITLCLIISNIWYNDEKLIKALIYYAQMHVYV